MAGKELIEKDYEWKKEQEDILKAWADKAICFKTMHDKASKKFWCLNAWFTIPVIIFSTITGTGNFAQASFPEGSKEFLVMLIGGINIFSGILSTISQYTGVAQTLEAHRFSAISWDKFSRKVQIELAKPRKDRSNAKDFVKNCQEDYDRLIEIAPSFSTDIIRWFNNMIDTGQYEEELNDCNQCCYEKFCFPFGCNLCFCQSSLFSCCSSRKRQDKKRETKEALKKQWKEIELPEVLGRIKPTKIAEVVITPIPTPIPTPVPTPPPSPKPDVNLYDIYDENNTIEININDQV